MAGVTLNVLSAQGTDCGPIAWTNSDAQAFGS